MCLHNTRCVGKVCWGQGRDNNFQMPAVTVRPLHGISAKARVLFVMQNWTTLWSVTSALLPCCFIKILRKAFHLQWGSSVLSHWGRHIYLGHVNRETTACGRSTESSGRSGTAGQIPSTWAEWKYYSLKCCQASLLSRWRSSEWAMHRHVISSSASHVTRQGTPTDDNNTESIRNCVFAKAFCISV